MPGGGLARPPPKYCAASMDLERQQEELNMNRKMNVRYLAELALLTAIVLIMAYTPWVI